MLVDLDSTNPRKSEQDEQVTSADPSITSRTSESANEELLTRNPENDGSKVDAEGGGVGVAGGDARVGDTVPPTPHLQAQAHHVTPGAVRISPGGIARVISGDGRSDQSIVSAADTIPPPVRPMAAPDAAAALHDNNALIEAVLVTDAEIYAPDPFGQTPSTPRKRTKQRSILCGGALLVVAVAISVGVGVSLGLNGKRGGTDNPTAAPDQGAANADAAAATESFRQTLPSYTLTALEDPTSPQSRALSSVVSPDQPQFAASDWNKRMTQRFALAALYYATGGDDGRWWLETSRWLDPASSECGWHGIECRDPSLPSSAATTVKSLNLTDNGLTGSLAPEVGLLSDLQDLVLRSNWLVGALPSDLVSNPLHQLTNLDVYYNSLTGSFPSEVGSVSSLQYLNLGYNEFTGRVPTELGTLTSIGTLRLESNAFTGSIPSELGRLTNTTDLRLYSNQFNGTIPATLFELTQLGRIVLSNNSLTGPFPTEIGYLTKLSWLSVGQVLLGPSSIPTELGYLTGEQLLDIWSSGLKGSIPTELGLLSSLQFVYLEDNEITGTIPTELGQPSLEQVWLYHTALSGSVPDALCRAVNGSTEDQPIAIDGSVTCSCPTVPCTVY